MHIEPICEHWRDHLAHFKAHISCALLPIDSQPLVGSSNRSPLASFDRIPPTNMPLTKMRIHRISNSRHSTLFSKKTSKLDKRLSLFLLRPFDLIEAVRPVKNRRKPALVLLGVVRLSFTLFHSRIGALHASQKLHQSSHSWPPPCLLVFPLLAMLFEVHRRKFARLLRSPPLVEGSHIMHYAWCASEWCLAAKQVTPYE